MPQIADGADQLMIPVGRAMGIAPRALLCGSAWRVNAEHFGASFDELQKLMRH